MKTKTDLFRYHFLVLLGFSIFFPFIFSFCFTFKLYGENENQSLILNIKKQKTKPKPTKYTIMLCWKIDMMDQCVRPAESGFVDDVSLGKFSDFTSIDRRES